MSFDVWARVYMAIISNVKLTKLEINFIDIISIVLIQSISYNCKSRIIYA